MVSDGYRRYMKDLRDECKAIEESKKCFIEIVSIIKESYCSGIRAADCDQIGYVPSTEKYDGIQEFGARFCTYGTVLGREEDKAFKSSLFEMEFEGFKEGTAKSFLINHCGEQIYEICSNDIMMCGLIKNTIDDKGLNLGDICDL